MSCFWYRVFAGDSDYIPLAQRARRMGRVVIGIGVEGSTSAAFKNACDEFSYYEQVAQLNAVDASAEDEPSQAAEPVVEPATEETPPKKPARRRATAPEASTSPADPQREAQTVLLRAMQARKDDDVDGWVVASALKQQIKRLDAGFDEKKLGFKSFTDFIKAHPALVELQEDGQNRRVRLTSR